MTMATAAVVEGLPNPPEKYQLKINKSDGVHNYLCLASFQGLFCLFTHALFLATSMHSGANWRLTNCVGIRLLETYFYQFVLQRKELYSMLWNSLHIQLMFWYGPVNMQKYTWSIQQCLSNFYYYHNVPSVLARDNTETEIPQIITFSFCCT